MYTAAQLCKGHNQLTNSCCRVWLHTAGDAGAGKVGLGGGGERTLLGSFDLAALENGLVLEAWNILRVLVDTTTTGSTTTAAVKISVWFNPMFPETGFVGNSSDAFRVPKPLPARIVVTDPAPLPPGELVLTAGHRDSMVDYVSALPTGVL
jgi:hypothetical protein